MGREMSFLSRARTPFMNRSDALSLRSVWKIQIIPKPRLQLRSLRFQIGRFQCFYRYHSALSAGDPRHSLFEPNVI